MIERDAHATANVFLFAFTRRAHVNGQRRLLRGQKLCRKRRAEAFCFDYEFRPGFQAVQSVLQISHHMIEPDAPESDRRFVFPARVRDDDDRVIPVQNGSSPCRILAVEADVDAPLKVRCREFA